MTELEVGKKGFIIKLDEEIIEKAKDNALNGNFRF